MAEFTCVPPVKEEQTANATHTKEEETGDNRRQHNEQENVLCQETYSVYQKTHDCYQAAQPTGHPWDETYNRWGQTTDTGRQQDEKKDVPNDETCGVKAEKEESRYELSPAKLCAGNPENETDHSGHPGNEMDHTRRPGKERDSRETHTTDVGLLQETCDVNLRDKPYKCDQCGYSAALESLLVQHLTKHTDEKPYTCAEYRYMAVHKSNLSQLMRTHTEQKPYKCDQCNYSTDREFHLVQHLRRHTGEKPYMCGECGFRTAYKSSLSVHMRIHTGEKPYKCGQCNYSATQESHLDKHLMIHTGEKPYMCGECGYRTTQKSALSKHMRTHTCEKSYKCDQCDFSTAYKSSLDKHMRKHEIEDSSRECFGDGRCARDPGKDMGNTGRRGKEMDHTGHPGNDMDCTDHIGKEGDSRETHTTDMGVLQDTCDVNCPKPDNTSTSQVQETISNMGSTVFLVPSSLVPVQVVDKHVLKQTGEKPYMCDVCGSRTLRKCNLSLHMKTDKEETSNEFDKRDYSAAQKSHLDNRLVAKYSVNKSYMCEKCGYRTAGNSHLSRHMKTHTRENSQKCDRCDFSAVRKGDLNRHMRVKHPDRKPYLCGECGYRAAKKSNLSQHKKTHTYKCDECGYIFSST
ncbi:zinc finger protein 208-like [Branchiostoma floridae]|uniref:Zinc finger protein 208-like n=1 Tax=Branchiostoma floridae TaxID=7739 RepID=A0A9J7L4T1_BRAFL|nr:zinc finger protein 208-like [Branchiostoma floridae]